MHHLGTASARGASSHQLVRLCPISGKDPLRPSPSATGAPCNGVLDTRGLELRNTVYAFRLSNPTCGPARHHARSPGRRRGRYSVHSPHHSECLRVLAPMRGQLKGKSSKLPGLVASSQYLSVQQKWFGNGASEEARRGLPIALAPSAKVGAPPHEFNFSHWALPEKGSSLGG